MKLRASFIISKGLFTIDLFPDIPQDVSVSVETLGV